MVVAAVGNQGLSTHKSREADDDDAAHTANPSLTSSSSLTGHAAYILVRARRRGCVKWPISSLTTFIDECNGACLVTDTSSLVGARSDKKLSNDLRVQPEFETRIGKS